MTIQFEELAETVTERVAELLGANVFVIDQRGLVIKSSLPHVIGYPLEAVDPDQTLGEMRVPLRLGTQAAEVVVGRPSNGDSISPRVAQALVELMINQAAVVDRLAHQPELKDRFIYDLLHGLLDDEQTILREARILNLDLAPPRAVILIDAAAYILTPPGLDGQQLSDKQIRRRAQLIISSVVSFFHLPNDTICAYIGNGEVAVLKASNTKNLVNWAEHEELHDDANSSWANLTALKRAASALLMRLRADTNSSINISIGRYHPGVRGLARSYQDAGAALALGRHFHGHNRVHCLDSLGIAAFIGVADERTKIDLATYLLSPLDHEAELIETLEAFFTEDCCPSAVASRLSIHRNTLSYRLDKITSLTGLNPRHFDDAVQIRLALLLRSLPGKSD